MADGSTLESGPTGVPGPIDPRVRRRRIVALVAIAVACLVAFALLAWSLMSHGWTSSFDDSINALIRPARVPLATVVLWLVSLPGDPPVIAPLTVVTALLLAMWGLRPGAVLLIATMAGEAVVQHFVEVLFARPRPSAHFALIRLPVPYAFPSGHAWASLLLAAILGLVLWRSLPRNWPVRVAIVSGVLAVALLVGASRVYLGVHWPTDVLGGWVLAVFSFVAVSAAYLWVVKRFNIKELDAPWGPIWFRVSATVAGVVLAVGLLAFDATLDPLTPGALRVSSSVASRSAGVPATRRVDADDLGAKPRCV
jgi:undecaprenyl-diphosphatase